MTAPVIDEEPPEENGEDDVFDAWGAIDDDDDNYIDPFTVAVSSNPTSPDPAANKSTPISFDDRGEPDFAGWLAAKNQAKTKNPLSKGLDKSASTNTVPTRRTTSSRVVPVPTKKIDIKPKDENVDDGWGDAWD